MRSTEKGYYAIYCEECNRKLEEFDYNYLCFICGKFENWLENKDAKGVANANE